MDESKRESVMRLAGELLDQAKAMLEEAHDLHAKAQDRLHAHKENVREQIGRWRCDTCSADADGPDGAVAYSTLKEEGMVIGDMFCRSRAMRGESKVLTTQAREVMRTLGFKAIDPTPEELKAFAEKRRRERE